VGYYFNGVYIQTLIEHWDGTSWTIGNSPNNGAGEDNYLFSVTCASASECWAVGAYKTGNIAQTIIERWDGSSWTIVASPNSSSAQHNVLAAAACVSESDCWAIGYHLAESGAYQTLLEHWNGVSWTIADSPNTSVTQDNYFGSLTCNSLSQCWAVGYYFNGATNQTLAARWDGTSWSIISSPNLGTLDVFYDVTCNSAFDCWAVGAYVDGTGLNKPLLERWDGSSWASVTVPTVGDNQDNGFSGVTCVAGSASESGSTCWAVGAYAGASNFYQTLIERYLISPVQLTRLASRKVHGSVGLFDIDLTSGNGVECRSGGATGNYTLVFTFANALTNVDSASVTSGAGSIASSKIDPADAHNYIVNLSGIPNAQTLRINLSGVSDSAGNFGSLVPAQMGVLLGDVNASRRVDAADVSSVRQQTLQPVTATNFRNDINASGRIDAADVSIARQQTLTSLP
jgi:hypothetical protein